MHKYKNGDYRFEKLVHICLTYIPSPLLGLIYTVFSVFSYYKSIKHINKYVNLVLTKA